ncbi:hypothetical protein DAPPUDRAFT_319597 [Daphnia pulex]|uniref:Uncharacterized protein n=1 Tax=Daphnia pulex TaxID=6669 RepID=E9GM84_DAPPU|nr:hypothetical protein DAPPUDRAFT_319597 [Daphnia pulex]|eukprot:EFX79432.1 hypothetical protein DAPPUDRAFT_319597 [Daphnia pulex]
MCYNVPVDPIIANAQLQIAQENYAKELGLISDPKTLPVGLTPLYSLPFNCDKWIHRSKTTKPIIINCCFNRKNAPCGTSTIVAYEVSCKRNLGLNKVQESSYQVCHDRSNDNTLYSVNRLQAQIRRHFQIMY